MAAGEIVAVNKEKGFAFIRPDGGGDDVFLHNSSINGVAFAELWTGARVEYELDESAEKPRAQSANLSSKDAKSVSDLAIGRVVSLVPEKGFGFLQGPGVDDDIFFHNSAVKGLYESLKIGDSVKFKVDETAEKPRASVVIRLGRSAAGPATGGRASRDARPANLERGFITKLVQKRRQGYISPDKGGSELRFDDSSLAGVTRYARLKIGDYVEFVRGEKSGTSSNDVQLALQVNVTERIPRKQPSLELPRNPKARKKKPTWR